MAEKGDQLKDFDDLYDMPEQSELREDCQALVGECVYSCLYGMSELTEDCHALVGVFILALI